MIFSVDVEDWSQSVLDRNNPVSDRVYANTLQILDILTAKGQKATFFILANVSEKFPTLLLLMIKEGHEVASHGVDHKNIDLMTPQQIHQEIESSVKTVEDISGVKVIGFRAPNFSINETVFEPFCEALARQGLRYDSSLFSIPVRKYKITKQYPLDIFNTYGIDEHYLTHITIADRHFPFFGGGYFRLFPYAMTKYFSNQYAEDAVFYMHPYEVDTGELASIRKQDTPIPFKWLITQFVRRGAMPAKLTHLLSDFRFSSFQQTYYSDPSLERKQLYPKKASLHFLRRNERLLTQ
jgi:polysaccharide deacetylase family protein (PEP-CTERM system associated)